MAENVEYSFWLLPEGDAKTELASIVQRLADRNESPVFDAHLTLLAGIHCESDEIIVDAAREIASKSKNFEVRFQSLNTGKFWTQCVFVEIDEKNEDLKNAHNLSKEACLSRGTTIHLPNPVYYPHVSLMYRNLGDAEKQAELEHLVGTAWCADFLKAGHKLNTFSVDKVVALKLRSDLVRPDSTAQDIADFVKSWTILGEFKFDT
ncbi:hypothetical protein CYMTET_21308 [Cymbomonas tetramitiformis]|uniref:Cyclic phosphodiesterase n=1 Tax=Cymbomonas tetramitiformis TaxID=36881 RepID=A0AAE0G2D1_9CHLO|nr:hypothetical protein CYMTET_21308 [Cymbomonas tetramitiformis]|eukprot:gene14119-16697_t